MVTKTRRGCPLGQTFFGLNYEYKMEMHKSLVITSYYSKGAFSVKDLYDVPVFLRVFYLKQLQEVINMESEAQKKALKGK